MPRVGLLLGDPCGIGPEIVAKLLRDEDPDPAVATVVIGDPQGDGGWAVRTYVKPFANWIWAGCIVMSLGGLISLSDRRYRVAAGARRSAVRAVAAE